MSVSISIPENQGRGRPTNEYYNQLEDFANDLEKKSKQIGFKMSARGWAYYFENEGIIDKTELDFAQGKINDCRDKGYLALDFVAKDDSRKFKCVENTNDIESPEDYAKWRLEHTTTTQYYDKSFWDTQDYFLQVIVEKVDLRELFEPICDEYNIRLW